MLSRIPINKISISILLYYLKRDNIDNLAIRWPLLTRFFWSMIRAIQDLSIIIRPTLKICTALLLPQIFSKSQDIAEIIIINQLCCFFRSISIPFYLHSISIWSTIDLDRIPPPETLHSANRVFRPRYRNGMYLSCTTAWRRTNATDNKRRSVDWGKRADGTVPRLRHRWISNFCPVWKPVAR